MKINLRFKRNKNKANQFLKFHIFLEIDSLDVYQTFIKEIFKI